MEEQRTEERFENLDEITIYFVRHGHSTWNCAAEQGILARMQEMTRPDAPLDALGIKQATYSGIRCLFGDSHDATEALLMGEFMDAVRDVNVPLLGSNLHRALDTAILFFAPLRMFEPEVFPIDGTNCRAGRKLQAMSELQEISAGIDAMPSKVAKHEFLPHEQVDLSTSSECRVRDEVHSRMREGFEGLQKEASRIGSAGVRGPFSNTSEAPPPEFWRKMEDFLSENYTQNHIDWAGHKGNANSMLNFASKSNPDLPRGKKARLRSIRDELGPQLFRQAAQANRDRVIVFGHSQWLWHVMHELGPATHLELTPFDDEVPFESQVTKYQVAKTRNCEVVAIQMRRRVSTEQGPKYEIHAANAVCQGWDKLTWEDHDQDPEYSRVEETSGFKAFTEALLGQGGVPSFDKRSRTGIPPRNTVPSSPSRNTALNRPNVSGMEANDVCFWQTTNLVDRRRSN